MAWDGRLSLTLCADWFILTLSHSLSALFLCHQPVKKNPTFVKAGSHVIVRIATVGGFASCMALR